MTTWTHDDTRLLRALEADARASVWARDSVVGSGFFNANGVEVGVVVEWFGDDCLLVTDGGEAWAALSSSSLVHSRPTSQERDRFDAVARKFDLQFSWDERRFKRFCDVAGFPDVAKRVAVASIVVDGWRFLLEPVRADESVRTRQIVERVTRIGTERDWSIQQNADVRTKTNRSFRARATLERARARIAVVPLQDKPEDMPVVVSAWTSLVETPVVFLAPARNYEAVAELARPERSKVVRKATVNETASQVVEAAEALADLLDVA